MARYRDHLPQLDGGIFLTDGGIETTLVFHYGLELPHFAAFCLLDDARGAEVLRRYFRTYADIAREHGTGFVFEAATWRSNPEWGARLGYSAAALADVNRRALEQIRDIRDELDDGRRALVLSGCIGPRGDGYSTGLATTADEAERYHAAQAEVFSRTDADMITAITMTNAEEGIGITRAAAAVAMPVVISFTVETDGRLPSGEPLADAVRRVDDATGGPAYYMINCAHPTHFQQTLVAGEDWTLRIRGLRANSSTRSHAELDEAEELDEGNPAELGAQHRELLRAYPHINVLGGCCGTDHRHVDEIAKACTQSRNVPDSGE